MSYETNPILNRIKILKGWKHSTFPTKTLNYSREIVLWFKVYLFLKVYLWCQNIKLLTCEIRIVETHTKILYLSLSKHIPKKKNIKSKWKTKSVLQNLKSPLVKTQNKKARFLLYRDLRTLKKKSDFCFNMNRKKIFSKAWISKARFSSWINLSQKIHQQRFFHKKQHNFFWRTKKLAYKDFNGYNDTQKWNLKFPLTNFTKTDIWWTKTQKNVLALLVKFQKDLFFLEKLLNSISLQKDKSSKKPLEILISYLTKEYQRRKKKLEKIQHWYQFCREEQLKIRTKPALNSLSKDFFSQISQQKLNTQLKKKLFGFKKQWKILENQIIFRSSKKKLISRKSFLLFLTSNKKNIDVLNFEDQPLLTQIKKILLSRHLRSTLLSFKIQCFKTPAKLRLMQIFRLLRFSQKTNSLAMKDVARTNITQNVSTKRKKIETQKLAYRLSFRYNYRQHLTLLTDFKLKYLITDLVQEYFSLNTTVKLFWPLRQFKNMKFYRLIFPEYQESNLKKKGLPWNLSKNLDSQNKRYIYIGQSTNHLKIKENIYKSHEKLHASVKLLKKKNLQSVFAKTMDSNLKKAETLLSSNFSYEISNIWPSKLKKKNKYLILKKKTIQMQSEKRLFGASKQSFISNLIITLTLFAKYLEAQPLADYLAKIIGATKKHALILKVIKTILRTLHFKRGVGYRIALIGRINGANKSRTLYLKKLNRNRSRQTFSKNVNFAMSQARATIGAFGVKIWVYS